MLKKAKNKIIYEEMATNSGIAEKSITKDQMQVERPMSEAMPKRGSDTSIGTASEKTELKARYGLFESRHDLIQGAELEKFVKGLAPDKNSRVTVFSEIDPTIPIQEVRFRFPENYQRGVIDLKVTFEILEKYYGRQNFSVKYADDRSVIALSAAVERATKWALKNIKPEDRASVLAAYAYIYDRLAENRSTIMMNSMMKETSGNPDVVILFAGARHIRDIKDIIIAKNGQRDAEKEMINAQISSISSEASEDAKMDSTKEFVGKIRKVVPEELFLAFLTTYENFIKNMKPGDSNEKVAAIGLLKIADAIKKSSIDSSALLKAYLEVISLQY